MQVNLTGHSPPRIIREKLQIQQGTTAARPPAQNLVPPGLLLVAMRERNMDMLEREIVLGELLQAQDAGVLGRVHPGAFFNQRRANLRSLVRPRANISETGEHTSANSLSTNTRVSTSPAQR
jgi:hypothetical protein